MEIAHCHALVVRHHRARIHAHAHAGAVVVVEEGGFCNGLGLALSDPGGGEDYEERDTNMADDSASVLEESV